MVAMVAEVRSHISDDDDEEEEEEEEDWATPSCFNRP